MKESETVTLPDGFAIKNYITDVAEAMDGEV